MRDRRAVLAGTVGIAATLAGCSAPSDDRTTVTSHGDTDGVETPAAVPAGPARYTTPQPTGNRLVGGRAAIEPVDHVDIDVEGEPRWLVAGPDRDGSRWTVVTAEGRVSHWRVRDGGATRLSTGRTASTHPPVVAGSPPHIVTQAPAASSQGGQVLAEAGDMPRRVFVADNGDLILDGEIRHRFAVDAPPDSRPAALGDGRVVAYGGRTDRYGHGALGDRLEPSSLVVLDPARPAIDANVSLPAPTVFEGLQPMAADLDGDGQPEVATTVADSDEGARIALFSPGGERLATGPVYGPGWRHQLVGGPLGPAGERELAVVLKPHVTHRLEFYRFDGTDLSVTATLEGFSTHTYGSRVLGGAVAADVDADGQPEVVLPPIDRRRLAVVSRTSGGATVDRSLPLDGRMRTNVTGVETAAGGVAIGAGTATGVRVWSGAGADADN